MRFTDAAEFLRNTFLAGGLQTFQFSNGLSLPRALVGIGPGAPPLSLRETFDGGCSIGFDGAEILVKDSSTIDAVLTIARKHYLAASQDAPKWLVDFDEGTTGESYVYLR